MELIKNHEHGTVYISWKEKDSKSKSPFYVSPDEHISSHNPTAP